MKYKKLGKTGLEVSRIVLGGGAVGGIIFKDGLDMGYNAIKKAMDNGINWIDSAPAYGGGKSEENIGAILKRLDKKPIISTKVLIKPEQFIDIEYAIMSSIENSLKTLSLDKVDVFQLHNRVDNEDFDVDSITHNDMFKKGGVLDTLQKAKDSGLTSNIGFTGLGKIETLKDMICDGRFDMMQSYVNILNPSALLKAPDYYDQPDYERMIDLAIKHDMGIVAIRVFAAGVLAGVKNIPDSPTLAPGASFPLEYKRLDKIKEVLGLTDKQVYKLALNFVFNNEKLGIAALGFAELEHMYKAISVLEDVPDEMLGKFEDAYLSGKLL